MTDAIVRSIHNSHFNIKIYRKESIKYCQRVNKTKTNSQSIQNTINIYIKIYPAGIRDGENPKFLQLMNATLNAKAITITINARIVSTYADHEIRHTVSCKTLQKNVIANSIDLNN